MDKIITKTLATKMFQEFETLLKETCDDLKGVQLDESINIKVREKLINEQKILMKKYSGHQGYYKEIIKELETMHFYKINVLQVIGKIGMLDLILQKLKYELFKFENVGDNIVKFK